MSSSPTEVLVEVTMPQMGVSIAEGTVTAWRKQPGDMVERDETVVEIATDKVETEVPAPVSGRLVQVLVEEGATVAVGTVLGTLESPGTATATGPQTVPHISPVVRRIAAEHSVDVGAVTGTGRGGRVTKRDIVAFVEGFDGEGNGSQQPLHTESPYREEPAAITPPEPEGSELSAMRRRIGAHMVRSLRTAAHCTTVVEADMSAVEGARDRLSYLPYVARATIDALRRHPRLNATMEGERLIVHDAVHLGIAVSLGDDGLIVPVVRDAHELSAEGLAARIADLAARARSKELTPDEVGAGTFTITNPGRYGALLATPIINQPQVAILDLEAVVKRAVVITDAQGRDSIAVRPMTYLCMSWDHRALDGAQAATFLAAVRRNLEAVPGWSPGIA